MLRFIELSKLLITFIISTLTLPYHFCVRCGVVREIDFCLKWVYSGPFVMYGFDNMHNTDAYSPHARVVGTLMANHIHVFGLFSGILLNLSKCGVVMLG